MIRNTGRATIRPNHYRTSADVRWADKAEYATGSFSLSLAWRGEPTLWPDIPALIALLGQLGSLGFRGRRGFGALAFSSDALTPSSGPIAEALARFSGSASSLDIRHLDQPTENAEAAIGNLGRWLKGWRSHGRSIDHRNAQPGNDRPPCNSGFQYAKEDHDAGYGLNRNGPTYRAALGLPIFQRCGPNNNNWEHSSRRGEGRFASPVLLRPHRTANGRIPPLVIFDDAHAWPRGKPVSLNGQSRIVSPDLSDAMKRDPKLKQLPS